MRIAYFGTFDVENYGDLLFPLLARRRLAEFGAELVYVSPVGGPPVWADCVPTVPPDALHDEPLDGVILGGGNIVHAGAAGVDHYRQDGLTWLLAYSRLWVDSARLAAERGIPLCWNAPGVPQRFTAAVAPILSTAVRSAAYVAVRDQPSLANLRGAGVDGAVDIVPDSAFDVTELFADDALDEAYTHVFADRRRDLPERVLAVHLNARYLTGNALETARTLDQLAAVTGSSLLLVALGRCHGDGDVARSVAAHLDADHVVIERPSSLREFVAAIARADGYVGSSLHGMITALAFGRPGIAVARETGGGKFTGLLRQFHLADRFVGDWEQAVERADLL